MTEKKKPTKKRVPREYFNEAAFRSRQNERSGYRRYPVEPPVEGVAVSRTATEPPFCHSRACCPGRIGLSLGQPTRQKMQQGQPDIDT